MFGENMTFISSSEVKKNVYFMSVDSRQTFEFSFYYIHVHHF